MQLAIFDFDGTLLGGDSDVLWCRFLIEHATLDPGLARRSALLGAHYVGGTVVPEEYARFQAALLGGQTLKGLQPLRERFLREVLRPRIPAAARALLQRHRRHGDTLVLTTATNRVVSELAAQDLGVDVYHCTELECQQGRFTGRLAGTPNMRLGKLERLRAWLAESGDGVAALKRACFYSDSINDLPLLSVVGRAIVVDPDRRLALTALRKGWARIELHGGGAQVLEAAPA